MRYAKSVGDQEKGLSILFRGDVAKIRSFEAECKQRVEARKTTIFSGVSMTRKLLSQVRFYYLKVSKIYDIIK